MFDTPIPENLIKSNQNEIRNSKSGSRKSTIIFFIILFSIGGIGYFLNPMAIARPKKPSKPVITAIKPCPPLKPGKISYKIENGKLIKTQEEPEITDPCQVTAELNEVLSSQDENEITEILSEELLQNYTEQQIETAILEGGELYGTITSFKPISSAKRISRDWAEQEVNVTTSKDFVANYKLIFHKENGQWKLFGTEELTPH